MKFDLHSHSHFSDGDHAPDFLLKRAAEENLTHLAITDHDCTTALEMPLDNCYGITLVPGVEISCDWDNQEIHIVGLGINWKNPILLEFLKQQQNSRRTRMKLIDEKLKLNGVSGLVDYLDTLPCTSFTRSHVADFLVNRSTSKNKQKAFKQYLGKKGKAYVPANWASLDSAINVIHEADGFAILAHPGRYSMNKRKLIKLVNEFSNLRGDGMETSYGGINPLVQKQLEELSKEASLYNSVGSDFHSTDSHWTNIGKYPALSQAAIKNAIWNHPRWHF